MPIRGSYNGPLYRKLGSYLVEAGLLTEAQVDVALNDQNFTSMRFGEVLAARGWVKQQTVEYLMEKIVLPDRTSISLEAGGLESGALNGASSAGGRRIMSRAIAQATVRGRLAGSAEPYRSQGSTEPAPANDFNRRELPISKPLPSVGNPDGDNWVG